MRENKLREELKTIDEKLSKRFIALDPKGYFIIKLSKEKNEIIAKHYKNNIDHLGRATDPETGTPIGCDEKIFHKASKIFKGKTAKEVGIKLSEGDETQSLISKIDHALYIGRELQRAEECLKAGINYIQD